VVAEAARRDMRRESEHFGDAELDLLYMARRLRDALRLEEILTAAGVDYLIETGTYTAGFIMKRDLTGAFFYVAPKDLAASQLLLSENHFRPYTPE
jgi:hypothetical protein